MMRMMAANRGSERVEARKINQHDSVNHQRGGDTKRDNIREGIEFAAKGTVLSSQTREAAVEHIENASTENEPDGGVKKRRCFIRTGPLNERALYDLKRGRESAEQIACRHQVGQQINLWIVIVHSGN